MHQLVLAGAIALAACSSSPPERDTIMVSAPHDETKRVVRRLFEDGFNRERPDVIDQLVAAEYVDATGERGPGAFKQVMARLRAAFPDIHYTIDDLLAEGDGVAIRWRWSGTHRGSFRGVAPTQLSLTNSGITIFRLRDGRIISAALETDRLGFLQAIGVVPPNDVLFRSQAAPPSR